MLTLIQPEAELYFPMISHDELKLSDTTHLGIGAHPDDLEIIAIHGILEAYDHPQKYFTGVTITDGRGAPRSGPFANMSDDDLWRIRCNEQKKAAEIGHYHAQILLNYPSQAVKSTSCQNVVTDIKNIITVTSPDVIYTHNLADKHDTHVGSALCVIQALRELNPQPNLLKLYGCETWRDLDWLTDNNKIALDVSNRPDLQEALLIVFESQIAGGKRYDLATIGRRQAHATFFQSHQTDIASRLVFAMNLTPLIDDPYMDIEHFVTLAINNFRTEVSARLTRLRILTGQV